MAAYAMRLTVAWEPKDASQPVETGWWGMHTYVCTIRAVSRKHALDKGIVEAMRLPAFSDRDRSGLYRMEAGAEIIERA